MPTLADLIRSDWTSLVADTSALGELVSFQPEGGGEVRSLTVVITEEGLVNQMGNIQQRDEVILVSVGRDETDDKGGILRPGLGDKLWRTGVALPELPYNWTGETVDVNPANWTLRFRREMPYRATAKR